MLARTCLRGLAAAGLAVASGGAVLDVLTASNHAGLLRFRAALRPDDVPARVALARLEPERAGEHLAAALAGSPRRTELRLALAAWESGRSREQELLKAARWDRGWEPAWELANHYAQDGRGEDAWRWLVPAARVWRGDPRPVFRLGGLLAKDTEIAGIAERVWPGNRARKREHLDYLLRTRHPAAHDVAADLAAGASAADAPWLGAYVRLSLEEDAAVPQLRVWRSLVAAGWLSDRGPAHVTALWPGNEDPLVWRTSENPGVRIARGHNGTLQVELQGSQPERCALACRKLLAESGEYRVLLGASDGAHAGVAWDLAARGKSLTSIPLSPASEAKPVAGFRVPEPGLVVETCLIYERPAGMVRARGRFAVPGLDWERMAKGRTAGAGYGTED